MGKEITVKARLLFLVLVTVVIIAMTVLGQVIMVESSEGFELEVSFGLLNVKLLKPFIRSVAGF